VAEDQWYRQRPPTGGLYRAIAVADAAGDVAHQYFIAAYRKSDVDVLDYQVFIDLV
jgi:hypothetical protein